jgi:hypothetical protein
MCVAAANTTWQTVHSQLLFLYVGVHSKLMIESIEQERHKSSSFRIITNYVPFIILCALVAYWHSRLICSVSPQTHNYVEMTSRQCQCH